MSHIEQLEEIRVNLLGRGLTRLEGMVDSLLQDMKAERTTVIDKMDKLEELSKPLGGFNNINGEILSSKMFGVK